MQETQVQSLGPEDPLEEEMATHSGILAWKVPWTEEPGGLQSMGRKETVTTNTSVTVVCSSSSEIGYRLFLPLLTDTWVASSLAL